MVNHPVSGAVGAPWRKRFRGRASLWESHEALQIVAGKLTPSCNQNQVVASPMRWYHLARNWRVNFWTQTSIVGFGSSLPSTIQKKNCCRKLVVQNTRKRTHPDLLVELMVFSMRKKCLWLDPATTSQTLISPRQPWTFEVL